MREVVGSPGERARSPHEGQCVESLGSEGRARRRRLRKKIYSEVVEETEKRVIVIDSIVQLYV